MCAECFIVAIVPQWAHCLKRFLNIRLKKVMLSDTFKNVVDLSFFKCLLYFRAR